MERASKLIRGLSLPRDTMTAEELACAAWPQAVGRKIAAHTRAARLVRTRLVVEVEDRVWQRQLFALTRFIVANLEKSIGGGLVEDLEFRVAPRRIEPGRAAAIEPGRAAAMEPGRAAAMEPGRAAAMEPGRAAAMEPGREPLFHDEAAEIADPVLRGIYRAARRRALA